MARVGFLALAARWFWDTEMGDSTFRSEAESRVKRIETALAESHEIVSAGLVTTEAAASSAVAKFREADVEGLIACCVMWSEDQPLLRVLEGFKETPLLLWSWTPGTTLPETLTALDLIKWSGPVGAQQISGALRRSGRRFVFSLGSDTKETVQKIKDFATAAGVARSLKHARIGLIPYRYSVMTNTWVDEFQLMTKLGVNVVYVSIDELRSSTVTVSEAEVKDYVESLHGIPVSAEVSPQGLADAVKISLGLAKIVQNMRLDAISIADLAEELHAAMKRRPCLYLPSVFECGTVVGMEGDLLCTVAQLILARLSGQPTMFTEIFTYDESRNQVVVGHAGMHDIRLAENREAVRITRDYEYPKEPAGVWMAFSVRPGPVTLLSIANTGKGFHLVVARGEALRAEGKLQGYPHGLVRLDVPLRSFFHRTTTVGTTQHWALVPGDLVSMVSKLASILSLECTIVNDYQES